MHPIVDAFWKGRSKFKKNIGGYFDREKNPRACCHTGAIYYGLYGYDNRAAAAITRISNDFPEFWGEKLVAIPCEHAEEHLDPTGYVGSILIHLNDEHDGRSWPDKKIAEWLETALN